ncbi:MAG: Wzz/FepE/Etk N-terminal domain-containing protein [Mycobacteriales bacterium]
MHAALAFLREQIHGIWRFRWTAMLVAWVVCLLGWIVVLALPDTYSATARVFVDTRTRLNQVTQGIAVESNMASEAMAVRRALLGAPQLAKVARVAIPGYAAAPPAQQADIVDGLHARLQVEATGERNQPADLYTIIYTDRDRVTARRVVKELLNLFLSNSLGGSQEGAEQAQQFLAGQIAEYDKKLQTS